MCKGKKCVIRTVMSLLMAGLACRMLMNYFSEAGEGEPDEFEGTGSEEPAAAGQYVVKKSDAGFVFNLKTASGDTIAVSEVYNSKNSCLNGIKSVKTNAPAAALEDQTIEGFEKCRNPKFEIYMDNAGEYRFRLKAKNGQIIATGKVHKSKKSCLVAVESIRKNAGADIIHNIDQ